MDPVIFQLLKCSEIHNTPTGKANQVPTFKDLSHHSCGYVEANTPCASEEACARQSKGNEFKYKNDP